MLPGKRSTTWSNRQLIRQLIEQEVSAHYKQSVLGILWAVVNPLLTLLVYAFVFLVIFRPRVIDDSSDSLGYVLNLYCGIIFFGVFSEVVSRAPLLIVSRPSLVKKVVFPIEVLPVVAFGTSAVFAVIGAALLLIAVFVSTGTVSVTLWLLPVALPPLYFFTVGLGWLLSSLGAYLRDTQHFTRALVQLFFFLTPVVWMMDLLPNESLRFLVLVNPLAVVIEVARDVMIDGQYPSWTWLGIAYAESIVVYILGRKWFERTRGGFCDVV